MDAALFILSFTGGVLSFLSPCAFPLLPSYILYRLAKRKDFKGRNRFRLLLRGVKIGLVVSAGFNSVFTVLGLASSYLLQEIARFIPQILLGMGLSLSLLGFLKIMGRRLSISFSLFPPGFLGALNSEGTVLSFLYGFIYAIASLGCSLPVFLMVVFVASGETTISMVLAYTFYFIGASVFMVLISTLTLLSRETVQIRFTGLMPVIDKLTGIVLFLSGVYMVFYEFIIFKV